MITVISYPNNVMNYNIAVPTSIDSSEMVQNLIVNVAEAVNEEYILISYNGTVTTLLITDECRYDPIDIFFQNRDGAQQTMTFFKAKKESISVKKETFESDRGQPLAGNHQFIDYNVNGKSSISVNSGFVPEEMNDTFNQLLLSERVWMLLDSVFVPLNVGTSSLEYKTRAKDRLINYEIEFKYSFNEINSI